MAAVAMGEPIQFFHEIDMADPRAPFIYRSGPARERPAGPAPGQMLQSHGWLDGGLLAGSLAEAAAKFVPADRSTWPVCVPSPALAFVDRYGKPLPSQAVPVHLDKIRAPTAEPPRLSLVLVRWGGSRRIGECDDPAAEGDGGWGQFGCPPCDWYINGVINTGCGQPPPSRPQPRPFLAARAAQKRPPQRCTWRSAGGYAPLSRLTQQLHGDAGA